MTDKRKAKILRLEADLQELYDAERDALYDRIRVEVAPLVVLLSPDPWDKGGIAE